MRKKKREQEKKSYEKKTAEDVYQIERKANFNEGKSQSRTTTRNKKKIFIYEKRVMTTNDISISRCNVRRLLHEHGSRINGC